MKRLLNIEETAEYLGIAPKTIKNQISNGCFPINHVKLGKLVKFDFKDVEEFVDKLTKYGPSNIKNKQQ
jgi:excisionase family DNA binding protein